MEEWEGKFITKNLSKLVNLTLFNASFLAELQSSGFMSLDECDELEACRTPAAQARLMYRFAANKRNGFDLLISALKKANQTGAVDLLEEAKKLHDETNQEDEADTSTSASAAAPPAKKPRNSEDIPNDNDRKSTNVAVVHPSSRSDPVSPGPSSAEQVANTVSRSSSASIQSNDSTNGNWNGTNEGFDDLSKDPEVLDFLQSKEKLDVVVETPARPMKENGLVGEYEFSTESRSLGLALVINMIEFEDDTTWRRRNGSDTDVSNLIALLTQLGYQIFPKSEKARNQPKKMRQDIIELIQDFKIECDKKKPSSVIVFVGSHGFHPNKIVTSDAPYGGEKKIPVTLDLYEDIVQHFYHQYCPVLKGKPKLFIVQACQDFRRQETDDCAVREPRIADAAVISAQMPGGVAYRDKYKGSWFVHCFIYMMMKHARSKSFQEIFELIPKMLQRINGVKGTEQVPTMVSYNLKKLYFPVEP